LFSTVLFTSQFHLQLFARAFLFAVHEAIFLDLTFRGLGIATKFISQGLVLWSKIILEHHPAGL
jgi:hypothetical protein